MSQTQEAKDIIAIKGDISSIRQHLKKIQDKQEDQDEERIEFKKQVSVIYNSLVDNDFNANNGVISKVSAHERKLILHDMYWKMAYVLLVPVYVALITILVKLFLKQ
jgi:ferric iron reductase protein FhuF